MLWTGEIGETAIPPLLPCRFDVCLQPIAPCRRRLDGRDAIFQHDVMHRLLELETCQPPSMQLRPGRPMVVIAVAQQEAGQLLAEGRVRLLRISSRVFLEALHSNPMLGVNLCGILAGRLRRTFAMFRDATFESLEVRLARQVLYLAAHGSRRTEAGLQLAGRFRQGDLADLLGATTRSIITILNAWRTDGLVIYDAAQAQLKLCREDDLRRLIGSDA
jgi:CRP-like cAMP-binding protein